MLQLHEFAFLGFLEGDRVKIILNHLLKLVLTKPRLVLSLPHCGPSLVGLILQVKYSEIHFPLLRALECVEQFFHAPNLVLERFGVGDAIVDRRVVALESLEHVRIIFLDPLLSDLH